ncbi:hypothetical protein C8A00DRAFT_31485 [Chaetomidium leptoderma]|uniref:BHLH domain-containing protein n=1 Tax=Chaetomidium leptoderma TaxID=669021 RepID=A0AAN6VQU8_9PEZI|nr:hypothetical protein C8A00DRAFT_31485 [Chaetomidium leptoderma]
MDTTYAVDMSLPSAEDGLGGTPIEYSTVDFSASSTSDQLFDGGLTELGDCHLHPIASQWPMLSSQSLLGPTPATFMHTNGAPESNMNGKVDRARKTKGSQRLHYAVEKRYRSTLNEKYATLARTLSSDGIQRICGTESRDWAVQMDGMLAGSKDKQGGAARQGKTATLSATIETINLLTRCCSREARDLEQLRQSVGDIRNRVRQILQPKTPLDSQHDGP